MAFVGALLYYGEATDRQSTPVTHRVELYKSGYGGGSTELGMTAAFMQFGDDTDDFDTVLKSSYLEVTYHVTSGEISDFEAIRTAGTQDYLLVHKEDGVQRWQGFVLPRFVTVPLVQGDVMQVSLIAKDRLKSLFSQTFNDETTVLGRKAARVLIAELLADTGHSLTYWDTTLWQPDAETGDPLDVMIPEEAFWRYREDYEDPEFLSKGEVLRQVLTAFGLQCVQSRNRWRLMYPGAFLSTPVTLRIYNTAGVKVSTSSVASTLDLSARRVRPTDSYTSGSDPFAEARITYDVGPFRLGEIQNGNFDHWLLTGGIYKAKNWTYDETANRQVRAPNIFGADQRSISWSIRNKGREVAGVSEPTMAQMKTAITTSSNNWITQSVGQFGSGHTVPGTRLKWLHQLWAENDEDAPLEAQGFIRIKLEGASNDYYWVRTGAHTGGFQLASGLSDNDKLHPIEDLSLLGTGQEDYISIASFPVTGTLVVELGPCAIGGLANYEHPWLMWDAIRLELLDENTTGEEAITYIVTDPAVTDGDIYEDTIVLGDGPFASARGAMYLSDDSTLTGSWRRKAAATLMPHTELIATEVMINRRASRRVSDVTTSGYPANLWPFRAYDIEGVVYWPSLLRRDLLGGNVRLRGYELLEDTSSVSSSTASQSSTGPFAGASSGARVYSILDSKILNMLIKMSTTTTTATILSGAQTTATINPVQGEVFRDNETVAIVDVVTGATVFVTMNGDYTKGSSTLTFDSYTFPHIFKVGSYVFADSEATNVRLAITENVIRAEVVAGELCQANETVTSTARTSLTVDGLNYDIKDNDRFWLRRQSGDASHELISTADQSATATTFNFDNGAGGSVTITCVPGDSIVPDAAFMNAQISVKATSINLQVEDLLDSRQIGKLDQSYSGTTTTLNLQSGSAYAVFDDQKLMVGTFQNSDWQVVTVNGDQAAATDPLTIDSISLTQSSGAWVITLAESHSSQIQVNRDNIDLRVTKTVFDDKLLGPLVALVNGTETGGTTLSVKWPGEDSGTGTATDIDANTLILIRHKTDDTHRVTRVRTAALKYATSLDIGDPEVPGSTSHTFTSVPDGSPVFILHGKPEYITTAMTIGVGTIDFEANLIQVNTGATIQNAAQDWWIDEDGFHVEAVNGLYADANAYDIYDGVTRVFSIHHDYSYVVDRTIIDGEEGDLYIQAEEAIVLTSTNSSVQVASVDLVVQDENIVLDVDSTAAGTAGKLKIGEDQDWEIFFDETSDIYTMIGRKHGGTYLFRGEDAGGTIRNMIAADPDGSADLYYDGAKELETISDGIRVNGSIDISGTKPTITGSRGGNAALADLLTKLATMGLLTDSTT